MDDELLVAYAFGRLTPADRAAVEAEFAARPDVAAAVARLQGALAPLAADRDRFTPPPGLATATVARVAEYAVAHELLPRPAAADSLAEVTAAFRPMPADRSPLFLRWAGRRADLAVAAGVGFLAVGLAVAGVAKVRHEQRVLACQNQLRTVYTALSGYGDVRGGQFPEAGTAAVPTAGAFVTELNRAGQFPVAALACPSAPLPADFGPPVGYAYTLGYRGADGLVHGVRRPDPDDASADWAAVVADLPPAGAGAHGRGQNVLYAGGTVRFVTTTAAGVNGDDIYHNDAGLVRAGLHRHDASLGRPADVP